MVKAGFERGVLSGKDLEDTLLWYFHWLFGGGPGLALAHWHLLTTWIMADLAQNDQHSGWARIDGFACERGRQDKITCIPAADYLEILPGFVSIMCKIDVRRGFIAARKAVPKRLRRVFFIKKNNQFAIWSASQERYVDGLQTESSLVYQNCLAESVDCSV